MKKLRTIIATSVLLLALISCSKEGPAGPKGDKGEKGDMGATGPQGGVDITTFNYTVTSWGSVPNILEITASDGLSIPESVVLNGAVLAYWKSGIEWVSFPVINNIGGGVFTYYRSAYHEDNFSINVVNSDGSATSQGSLAGTPRDIKIVVIPNNLRNPDVDQNNYAQVKAAYNLRD